MKLHKEVKKNLETKYAYLSVDVFRILGTRFILRGESAFAPYVGFGVLMTSKLGTNVILMRYVAAISPMKDSKSW